MDPTPWCGEAPASRMNVSVVGYPAGSAVISAHVLFAENKKPTRSIFALNIRVNLRLLFCHGDQQTILVNKPFSQM